MAGLGGLGGIFFDFREDMNFVLNCSFYNELLFDN
jgi:hypothetical protein